MHSGPPQSHNDNMIVSGVREPYRQIEDSFSYFTLEIFKLVKRGLRHNLILDSIYKNWVVKTFDYTADGGWAPWKAEILPNCFANALINQ